VSDQSDIPVLTDLIEKGMEITLSDLGLDDDLEIKADNARIDNLEIKDDDTDIDDIAVDEAAPDLGAIDPFEDNPALEYAIYRILEEHMELAWQEIKLAVQRDLNKP
jgi:hypothetical protein